MASLLKDVYNTDYINNIANTVARYDDKFDKTKFIKSVLNADWPEMELKQRTNHIAQQLFYYLPNEYHQALPIIVSISPNFTGYEGMFTPAFVELYGLNEFSISIDALTVITEYASAEFAVRPFILKYPEQMQEVLINWCKSDNEHHRRLASEGCRPRLPWASALPEFKKDPAFILPILEMLKADSSEYVRRSVANNLNDIAKDHPELVITLAKRWLAEDNSKNRSRLVKHACRTLLKQAEPKALWLFGYAPPEQVNVTDLRCDSDIALGETVNFSFIIRQQQNLALNKIRIEFAIDFMKKNGSAARKIFKISESVVSCSEKQVKKSFSFKPISTRKYYPGKHGLAIIINGVELAHSQFNVSANHAD